MLIAQQQRAAEHRRQQRTTTTTTTTTRGVPEGGAKVWWCCTVLAVLKWLEVLFAVIIVAVLAPVLCISPGQYDFIMFVAGFCLCVTALTMIVYFLRLHVGPLTAVPWRKVELGYNVLAIILYITAAGIGIYHCVKLFQNEYGEMAANEACTYKFRGDWQFYEEWRGRLAAVTAFAVLSAVLHVFSAIYAKDVYI